LKYGDSVLVFFFNAEKVDSKYYNKQEEME